jgi:hypothetical protein
MVGKGFGRTGAQQRHGMKGWGKVLHAMACKVWPRCLKILMQAHMSCRDLGWAELGQKTDAGLGQKNRCWAGQRPDAGLDRGQMLGWTEARGWARQRPEVGLDRGSTITRELRHQLQQLHLGRGAGQDRAG